MGKGYFVSDLHLFASRTQGPDHLEAIRSAASDAETFVLGGDIFDFRWTTAGTIEETVTRAVAWLGELTGQCPRCHFHYLLGNHDYHHLFIERLSESAGATANLSWHRFYVRLGDNLFLHGDAADKRMTAEMLAGARSRCLHDSKRGPILSLIFELAVMTHLMKVVHHLAFPRRLVARRIVAYLEDIGQGPAEGVRNVYFGHTHLALSNYRYGGLTFHNGGAPMSGFEFRIVRIDCGQ